jgi:PST family polysaccharide transporter
MGGWSIKNRLLGNISALGVMQIFNYGLPLLTIPYLTRVLGFEIFGVLAIATAFSLYFFIVIEYGFSLSATRAVAKTVGCEYALGELYISVTALKVCFSIVSLLTVHLIIMNFPYFYEHQEVYYYSVGVVICQSLLPVWFYQGVEDFKYILYSNAATKILITVLLFMLVKNSDDYAAVPQITFYASLLLALLSNLHVMFNYRMVITQVTLDTLVRQLRDGSQIFYGRIMVHFYTSNNVVLLGFMTNSTIVGYYSLAERLVLTVSGIGQPIFQAMFPYLTKLKDRSASLFNDQVDRLIFGLFLSGLVVASCVYLFAEYVVLFVAGELSPDTVIILRILAFSIPLGLLAPHLSNALIVACMDKAVTKVIFITVILNCLLVVPLILYMGGGGLAVAVLIVYFIHVNLLRYEWNRLKK